MFGETDEVGIRQSKSKKGYNKALVDKKNNKVYNKPK